ncbi:Hypp4841 [Branchiostoma lanceolatum]|uniref:Hypp4841 protein n=1 Tax=Branchiostoma lanceolatum TaxID=7740 RepID=A0A8K0ACV5_BRALA|nr:Hypp4841 [Branchiostoma lanceolatum]
MAPNLRKRKRATASSTSASANKRSEPEETVVTKSAVRKLLDNQKKELSNLMGLQQKNFKSFIQTVMATTNRRMDDIVREVEEVTGSLQNSQKEIVDLKATSDVLDDKIFDLEGEILQLECNTSSKLPPPGYNQMKIEPVDCCCCEKSLKEKVMDYAEITDDSDVDARNGILEVFVKAVDGPTVRVIASKNAAVDKLIRKISEVRNVPIGEVRLFYLDHTLEYGQGKRLNDYGIEDQHSIYL